MISRPWKMLPFLAHMDSAMEARPVREHSFVLEKVWRKDGMWYVQAHLDGLSVRSAGPELEMVILDVQDKAIRQCRLMQEKCAAVLQ